LWQYASVSAEDDLDPETIKAKLDEIDAQLARKLAELGFTREEAARQMDRSVPEAVRKAQAEQVLGRKFVQELNDPRSGALDMLIEHVARDVENQLPEIASQLRADKARRRRNQIIAAVVVLLVAGAAIWYFALRDRRSLCTRLAEPIDELGTLVGEPLKPAFSYAGKYHCSQSADTGAGLESVITIDIEYQAHRQLDGGRFSRTEQVPFGNTTAQLYIADKAERSPSPEELVARARARVGKSRDPIGDVLSELPPSEHILLFEFGGNVATVRLNNKRVTIDEAKAVAAILAQRVAGLQ
jgi:hypothetical protein